MQRRWCLLLAAGLAAVVIASTVAPRMVAQRASPLSPKEILPPPCAPSSLPATLAPSKHAQAAHSNSLCFRFTSENRLNLSLPPFEFPELTSTRRCQPSAADTTLLQLRLRNALDRRTLQIVIFGGSATCGHGCDNTDSSKFVVQNTNWTVGTACGNSAYTSEHFSACCSWSGRLHVMMSNLLNITVDTVNLCEPGASIDYASRLLDTKLPQGRVNGAPVDLIIVDTSVNDANLWKFYQSNTTLLRANHEQFVRRVLLMQARPALVYLTGGIFSTAFFTTEEEQLAVVNAYHLPAISYRDCWRDLLLRRQKHAPVRITGAHPSWLGHEVIAQMVARWLLEELCQSAAHINLSPLQRHDLPPPIYLSAEEADEAVACSAHVAFDPTTATTTSKGNTDNGFFGGNVDRSRPCYGRLRSRAERTASEATRTWALEVEHGDKPGWLAHSPGDCVEFDVSCCEDGRIVVGFLRSYENIGKSLVQVRGANTDVVLRNATLDGYWTNTASLYAEETLTNLAPGNNYTLRFINLPLSRADAEWKRRTTKFKLLAIFSY